MRWKLLSLVLSTASLAGCLRSVTIPQMESDLKVACHGKDQVLAYRGGIAIYRCGEGDQAKYAAYVNGQLTKEANEIVALGAASEVACMNAGLKSGSPEHAACVRERHGAAISVAGQIRANENAAADERQRRALVAVAAVGAAAAAGAAASTPAYQPAPAAPLPLPITCNSRRLGGAIQTNCF